MGIILSRVRKKKSTVETLEKLENDIKEIEENRSNAQKKYKRITKLLLVYSLGLYVLCGIIFYFQFTSTLKGKLLYLVPLAVSPLLLYLVKQIISWYFVRKINKNQQRLNEMKKEKKRILEEVMDKETYKVAKQILEKFSKETVSKPSHNVMNTELANDGARKRVLNSSSPAIPKLRPEPNSKRLYAGNELVQPLKAPSVPTRNSYPGAVAGPMRFPAPVLPLERSYVDRIVEYLIGDGPNNRYALICSQCHSHNGMALKEEFEYIGFKCCYCFFFNPARKVRPEAPRLEVSSIIRQDSDSDSEKTGEASDGDYKNSSDEKPGSVKENGDCSKEKIMRSEFGDSGAGKTECIESEVVKEDEEKMKGEQDKVEELNEREEEEEGKKT